MSKLGFELSSTDNGDYGMNTPAYFCFDNFGAEGKEVLPERNVDVTTGVESVAMSQQSVRRFAIDGRNLNAAQKGINIVRMNDGTVRKVIVK